MYLLSHSNPSFASALSASASGFSAQALPHRRATTPTSSSPSPSPSSPPPPPPPSPSSPPPPPPPLQRLLPSTPILQPPPTAHQLGALLLRTCSHAYAASMQSRVTPCGYSSERCGYCKDTSDAPRRPNARASYYFSSQYLTVDLYQILVDRGWRRSGTIFYKPDVLRHCCPHYTIRLPVASFKPSKEQRKAINHWNNHVLGVDYSKEAAKRYPVSKAEKARLKNSFDLTHEIHRAEAQAVKKPPEPAHHFEVTLEPAEATHEKYELFANYQQNVHKEKQEDISMTGFKRFLCTSPLQQATRQIDGNDRLLGSYHQCYRLDGRLIAMGVLDLLPHCVSGVYMLYHSDFEKWQFGKLSALREAALALSGGYQYYYMGYYIHSCTKMKYKGDYKTQHVLDPESYEWNPLDAELKGLLDRQAYVSLSRERRLNELNNTATVAIKQGEDDTKEATITKGLLEFPLPTAGEAGEAVLNGKSLFELKVPGVMTAEEVEEQLDLDTMPIRVGNRVARAQDLMSWDETELRNPRSIKGIIGELVACLGPEAARQVVVDFG